MLLNNDIDIAGNFTTSGNTSVFNTGGKYIKLAGNFTNANGNSTFQNTGTLGTLEFNGSAAQSYNQGASTLDLNFVLMNHSRSWPDIEYTYEYQSDYRKFKSQPW